MSIRLLTTSAIALLLAGPAFADCSQDIAQLDQAVIEAETGASDTPSGMPATEHQQAVLGGKEPGASAADPAATDGMSKSDMPGSPHQQQVLADDQKGEDGAMAGDGPAELLAKAEELAKAGDEAGCMQQVSELKSRLGIQ